MFQPYHGDESTFSLSRGALRGAAYPQPLLLVTEEFWSQPTAGTVWRTSPQWDDKRLSPPATKSK